jgi:hypothetical protein
MPKVMTRPDFDALDPVERGHKIREGFRIVDIKPTPKPRPALVGKLIYRPTSISSKIPNAGSESETATRWSTKCSR